MMARRQQANRALRARERGVTLIIALIMLIIIGLTSASVMRATLNSDQVANNTRTQTLAHQAADVALRYCERQVTMVTPGIPIRAAQTPPAWESFASWYGGAKVANEVTAAAIGSAISSFTPSKLPECIAERSDEVAGAITIIVTARGFSPDYAESDTGRTTAGSVVWLQSKLRL